MHKTRTANLTSYSCWYPHTLNSITHYVTTAQTTAVTKMNLLKQTLSLYPVGRHLTKRQPPPPFPHPQIIHKLQDRRGRYTPALSIAAKDRQTSVHAYVRQWLQQTRLYTEDMNWIQPDEDTGSLTFIQVRNFLRN
jgi:hypothetical protein